MATLAKIRRMYFRDKVPLREIARHRRCFDRYQTAYDWQHYVGALQRKPGALRNGAPFTEMPERLKTLQRHLLRHEGGDRVMAQILAAVVSEGLEPGLVAVELALESGNISGDHVLNVLARLQSPLPPQAPVETSLTLTEEPQANVHRYDHLRTSLPEEVNDVE